jgi:hypothetical protein
MPKDEIVFRPKYNGSMRFAMILWPVWVGLFFYFLYQGLIQNAINLNAFLAFVFGAMAATLPFRVFREIHFGDEIVVKRYLQPDLVIKYADVNKYGVTGLWAKNGNVTLLMLNHDSAMQFGKIIQKLINEKKIKLKKTSR